MGLLVPPFRLRVAVLLVAPVMVAWPPRVVVPVLVRVAWLKAPVVSWPWTVVEPAPETEAREALPLDPTTREPVLVRAARLAVLLRFRVPLLVEAAVRVVLPPKVAVPALVRLAWLKLALVPSWPPRVTLAEPAPVTAPTVALPRDPTAREPVLLRAARLAVLLRFRVPLLVEAAVRVVLPPKVAVPALERLAWLAVPVTAKSAAELTVRLPVAPLRLGRLEPVPVTTRLPLLATLWLTLPALRVWLAAMVEVPVPWRLSTVTEPALKLAEALLVRSLMWTVPALLELRWLMERLVPLATVRLARVRVSEEPATTRSVLSAVVMGALMVWLPELSRMEA